MQRADGRRGGGGAGGHVEGRRRRVKAKGHQLCEISLVPQRIGLRPVTITLENRSSAAEGRSAWVCTRRFV